MGGSLILAPTHFILGISPRATSPYGAVCERPSEITHGAYPWSSKEDQHSPVSENLPYYTAIRNSLEQSGGLENSTKPVGMCGKIGGKGRGAAPLG